MRHHFPLIITMALMGFFLWGYINGNFEKLSERTTPEEKAEREQRALDRLFGSDQAFPPSAEEVTTHATGKSDNISWKTLANVTVKPGTFNGDTIGKNLKFSEDIRKLEGKTITITGYIFPLEAAERHQHFLLSALPPSCPYCLPGGPADLIEVEMKEPIGFSFSPITLYGVFHIGQQETLKKGIFYCMTEGQFQKKH